MATTNERDAMRLMDPGLRLLLDNLGIRYGILNNGQHIKIFTDPVTDYWPSTGLWIRGTERGFGQENLEKLFNGNMTIPDALAKCLMRYGIGWNIGSGNNMATLNAKHKVHYNLNTGEWRIYTQYSGMQSGQGVESLTRAIDDMYTEPKYVAYSDLKQELTFMRDRLNVILDGYDSMVNKIRQDAAPSIVQSADATLGNLHIKPDGDVF